MAPTDSPIAYAPEVIPPRINEPPEADIPTMLTIGIDVTVKRVKIVDISHAVKDLSGFWGSI
ncbi:MULTISPECIES: hypothetical protein [Corynebacterium]|uniref:Uncharacterized protein n=2 Tax=Corynebacterium TaxID=1716 RepID=A0A934I7C8_9CORY|nr:MULTISPECIES: hypothetical protein [Corynebacterium]MBI8989805.1 hypothetical protein [Corynebacterium meridianum]MCK7677783.1 hypothetical protein [Corynebacterium meridianum]MCX7492089.1 hypothetical protein [Corynebacterium antarcticum]MCX7537862.1 hypothetical protein [Corynebacterium antarcticum]